MATYRIPNTYQTPIASALGNLMGAFASLPSPEERALKAAQVEQAQSTAALNRQKITDAQREAADTAAFGGKLAGAFRKAFTPVEDVRPTPEFVGPIPEVPPDIRARNAAIDLAGSLPEKQIGHLPALFLSLFANAPRTTQGVVERSQIGAGKPYSSTQTAVDNELNRKMEVEDNRNIRFDKSQRYAADRAAQAQMAIAERQADAAERTGRLVYSPDSPTGIAWHAPGTSAHGLPGVPPQAANSLQNKAAERTDALNVFEQNLADFENLAVTHPNAMGFSGDVARIGSGLMSQGQSLAQNFGVDLAPLIAKGQSALAGTGLSLPSTSLAASQLDTYGTLIPRLAAKAFGESTGAGFSNKDAERYAKAFGESPIANVQDLQARIASVRQMLKTDMAIYGNRAGNKASPGLGSTVTNTFQPPAAPAATPAASPGTSDPLGIRR